MHTDRERCLRAVRSRDARFDGWFYSAVVTTGIYCRPSCLARPPKATNLRFHPSAASAQQAGFRACKRCRPDASPGSPEWSTRADVVARADRAPADRDDVAADGPDRARRRLCQRALLQRDRAGGLRELADRAAPARTHAARLVAAHGEPVDAPGGGLTHLFPAPATLAGVDPATLAMPASRRRTLLALAGALAAGDLDLGPAGDWAVTRRGLHTLPGLGPWTVEMIAMCALGDPDAFAATDLGVVKAARALGLPASPAALGTASQRWRPWRAYAVQHLWATGEHAVNRLPAG